MRLSRNLLWVNFFATELYYYLVLALYCQKKRETGRDYRFPQDGVVNEQPPYLNLNIPLLLYANLPAVVFKKVVVEYY